MGYVRLEMRNWRGLLERQRKKLVFEGRKWREFDHFLLYRPLGDRWTVRKCLVAEGAGKNAVMLMGTLMQLGFTVWVVNNWCRGCFRGDSVAAEAGFVSGRVISCRRCSVLSRREGKTVEIDQTKRLVGWWKLALQLHSDMKLPVWGTGGDRDEFREFVGCAHGWMKANVAESIWLVNLSL